jgi:acetyltransferase-like isoleucine patch superfamily enzyme
LYVLLQNLFIYLKPINGSNNKIIKTKNYISRRVKLEIRGNNNVIRFMGEGIVENFQFLIVGSNNTISIGSNSRFTGGGSIWVIGDNCTVKIGQNVTVNHSAHFIVQEDNMSLTIGDNCMISYLVTIRTSDSHPIYCCNTNNRLNPPQSIIIGDGVWIAAKATIMKGTELGDGCVVAYQSGGRKIPPPFINSWFSCPYRT